MYMAEDSSSSSVVRFGCLFESTRSGAGIRLRTLQGRVPPLFFLPPLLHLAHRLLRQLLPEQPLHDVLLARHPVPDDDQQACCDVARDRAAQDHRRQRERPHVVVDPPCAGAERDLEYRVEVEQDDDGDEEAERERVVRRRLVGLVEGVRLGKLVLVVLKLSLLEWGQHAKFRRLLLVSTRVLDIDVLFTPRW